MQAPGRGRRTGPACQPGCWATPRAGEAEGRTLGSIPVSGGTRAKASRWRGSHNLGKGLWQDPSAQSSLGATDRKGDLREWEQTPKGRPRVPAAGPPLPEVTVPCGAAGFLFGSVAFPQSTAPWGRGFLGGPHRARHSVGPRLFVEGRDAWRETLA